MTLPAWPFKARGDDSPLLNALRLAMLKYKWRPPKIIPNLTAARLPVIIKERKPPTESNNPAKEELKGQK